MAIRKKVTVRSLKGNVSKKESAKKEESSKASKKFVPDMSQVEKMIQERAYFIWEERGKPAGQDQDIWNQAKNDIMAKIKK